MDNRSQTGRTTGGGSRGPGLGSSKGASDVSLQPSLPPGASGPGASTPGTSSRGTSSHGVSGHDPMGMARDSASEAKNVADSLTKDIKEAAKTASRAVKDQASDFATSVGHELSKTAEDQKARGVEAMQSFARAITCAAAELEGQSPRVAQSVRDAAKKVEGLSENISSRNVDDLMKAATELARSQPMLFIGGAVAAGFALSRFLKSSANGQSFVDRRSNASAHSSAHS